MRRNGQPSRSGRSTVIIGADFETDIRTLPDGRKEGFVCQWAAVRARDRSSNVNDYTEVHGYTLDEFSEYIFGLLDKQSTKFIVYYHNLKYDIQFMRSLMHDLHELCKDDEEPPVELFRESAPIMLRYRNVEFRDSLKKAPGSTVQSLGEMIGLPKLESPRGNFDEGWSKDLTDDDFQYVIHDAAIVALAMKRFHADGQTACTISGDAWKDIQTEFNKEHCDYGRNGSRYGQWNEYFPRLTVEMDEWLRPAYMGGLNISWMKGRFEGINHLDRNSMFPSVMAGIPSRPSNRTPYLPYGTPVSVPAGCEPRAWCSENGYPCFAVRGWVKLKLRKGMKPWFKFKHTKDRIIEGLTPSDYVIGCREWHELTLTDVDIDNLNRCYELLWKPDAPFEAYAWKGAPGLFRSYVMKWYGIKKEAGRCGDKLRRQLAKLMLNSSYGRFGMSRIKTDISIQWSDEVGWDFVNSEYLDDETAGYLPVACWVTALARWALIDAILTVGMMNVIHCDTDSVIYLGDRSLGAQLGNTDELGDWGFEGSPQYIIEGGVKRYIEVFSPEIRTLKDIGMACAGVPQKQKDGVPSGMWIELLDDPMLITDTGYELGQEHYRVRSGWLRQLLGSGGKNPDDVDTRKLISGRSTLIMGGMILKPTTMHLNDNMRLRFRG